MFYYPTQFVVQEKCIDLICILLLLPVTELYAQDLNKKLSNQVNWNIPAPKSLDELLEQAVKNQIYSTKSDFVRDSVRRRLEQLGLLH